jgi:hypothetical protein
MTDEMKNEIEIAANDELIHVEEEAKHLAARAEDAGRRRIEEISVRGDELRHTLGRLAQEGRARKITVRNRYGRTLIEIPLILGAAGVLIIGPYTALLLAAAWLSRVSILIEYEELPATEPPATLQIEPRVA